MGIVYKARDPQIDRFVALKTISLLGLEPEEEEEFRKRFRYEARAAGSLHHPSIVTVFDVGEDSESREPYIVFEYVAGESLSRILSRQKKLPFPTALQLTEELAGALDYAHTHGVVHRDIKPANILISEDGHAKIADFGIAKLNLAHSTLPGHIIGTPAFMAPEQLSGDGVDGRSDLFSLGVILYAMIVGHSPFQGNSTTTVCFKVVNRDPVPATSFDFDLPGALDTVIEHAMAKDPSERYQRGSEFAADLQQLREQFELGSTATSTGTIAAPAKTGSRNAFQPRNPVPNRRKRSELRRTAFALATLIAAAGVVLALALLGIALRRPAPRVLVESAHGTSATSVNSPQIGGPVASAKQNSTTSDLAAADGIRAGTPSNPSSNNPKRRAALAHKPEFQARLNQKPGAQATPEYPVVPASTLELSVQHQFKEATLQVWIDDKLALTRVLHGGTQKHLVFLGGVRGVDSETLRVPAGTHLLRLQAQSADQSIDLSKTIPADFVSGDDKTLQVTFDKHNTVMHLDWQ